MRRLLLAITLVALFVIGCGSDDDDGVAAAVAAAGDSSLDADQAAARFGSIGCASRGEPVGLGALAIVDRWVALTAADAEKLSIEDAAVEGSALVDTERGGAVKVFHSMVPGVVWGLTYGDGVDLAVIEGEKTDAGPPLVLYAIARHADGTPLFVGGCSALTLMEPLVATVGQIEAIAALDDVIGETDPDELAAILGSG